MTDLSQLAVFVRVVDLGSFTAAAESLGVSKSFASRQVSQLEDRLGARLLNRTTRKVTLTDIGKMFHERCTRILDELSDAETAVTQLQTTPKGLLRMSVPMSFGLRFVAPVVAELMERHAALQVDIEFSDRRADLLGEGLDLAVRIGKLADSSLIAKKLAATSQYVCASERYLAAHGEPTHPDELRHHDALLYAYQVSGQTWDLEGPDGVIVHAEVHGRLLTNNGDALLDAARRGQGIAYVPDFLVAEELHRGRLRRILPGWSNPAAVWAIYPQNRHLSAKVRLCVELLAERLNPAPWAGCVEAAG